jgi:hypothetical protein
MALPTPGYEALAHSKGLFIATQLEERHGVQIHFIQETMGDYVTFDMYNGRVYKVSNTMFGGNLGLERLIQIVESGLGLGSATPAVNKEPKELDWADRWIAEQT